MPSSRSVVFVDQRGRVRRRRRSEWRQIRDAEHDSLPFRIDCDASGFVEAMNRASELLAELIAHTLAAAPLPPTPEDAR